VFQYQSQAFDILLIDEATHFTWSIVDYLITRNRSTIKDGPHPFRVFATNPGNVGHTWYLQLFDLLRGMGEHQQVKEVTNPNGSKEKTIFIPAFIQDNQIGVSRDPNYEARLMARDALVGKALLEGDWTVFAGQAFASWSYTDTRWTTRIFPMTGQPGAAWTMAGIIPGTVTGGGWTRIPTGITRSGSCMAGCRPTLK